MRKRRAGSRAGSPSMATGADAGWRRVVRAVGLARWKRTGQRFCGPQLSAQDGRARVGCSAAIAGSLPQAASRHSIMREHPARRELGSRFCGGGASELGGCASRDAGASAMGVLFDAPPLSGASGGGPKPWLFGQRANWKGSRSIAFWCPCLPLCRPGPVSQRQRILPAEGLGKDRQQYAIFDFPMGEGSSLGQPYPWGLWLDVLMAIGRKNTGRVWSGWNRAQRDSLAAGQPGGRPQVGKPSWTGGASQAPVTGQLIV